MREPRNRSFGAYNIAALREGARRRLPRGIFEYVERGAEDDFGLAANRAAFAAARLLPKVARDVSRIDKRTTLFGRELALPLVVAPTGSAGLVWHDGDVAIARAAAAARIPFTISSATTMHIEEIASAGGNLWFQLYLWADRALSHEAMARAHAAGCEVMMLTVDLPVPPNREFNLRNGFGTPFRIGPRNAGDILLHPRWLAGVLGRYLLGGGLFLIANISGGSLDGSLPTFTALPRIVEAVGDKATVLLDSGVRRGSDIVRALAAGAKAVMVGRAPLYGLAVGGEAGVAHALRLLAHEFRTTMAMVGARDVGEITPDLLAD